MLEAPPISAPPLLASSIRTALSANTDAHRIPSANSAIARAHPCPRDGVAALGRGEADHQRPDRVDERADEDQRDLEEDHPEQAAGGTASITISPTSGRPPSAAPVTSSVNIL